MRKHLLGLMLITGMAGCTSESDIVPASGTADSVGLANPDTAPTAASLAAMRESTASFAALPDRGELLAYGGARKARTSGAYTWHPVAISEEHALNAIGSGRLVLNTPDGQALDLQYERHEEQPDGNWTWIGRSDDGTSAVLTFGEKAVFGMISGDDAHYRVRTDRSGAWVVATDPRLVAANGGRPKDGNDVLMPPESRALAAAVSRHLDSKSMATSDAIPNKATAVVDVLIGYSSTIASELGSQAAAITLMSNLAAAANAAYANSGVNMRLRLVHAMSVSYADNTRNRDALQQLTGYNVDTQQPVTPNAAFNALRAARNEYGADLVAFVRRYREPEQDGCGIAWLLGMDQSGISTADEAFGYAVVSDGSDRDEGDNNTYFCSQFSLAHELGHLMGQAHDRDNATDAGVHSYSYGYREASPTGFFTIMAYPSGNAQIEAPYFANPAVRFSNRPTGTSTTDNVRSMNSTMPIVARFRNTVVPMVNAYSDFNGDGLSDVVWRNNSSGQNQLWASPGFGSQALTGADSTWLHAGIGDFNGDGMSDLVWRRGTTTLIWYSGNSNTRATLTSLAAQWQISGVGDLNGDGKDDLVLRDSRTSGLIVWYSANSATRKSLSPVNSTWALAAVADLDGDGKDDLLWRSNTGANMVWSAGEYAQRRSLAALVPTWSLAASGDLDGDGKADLIWRHAANGASVVWRAGNLNTRWSLSSLDSTWTIAAVADYNGDGRDDVLWRRNTGANVVWFSGNVSTRTSLPVAPGGSWRVLR
ncbi:FG-GAP-like repeat-containing protein [Luteimonas sp. A611]